MLYFSEVDITVHGTLTSTGDRGVDIHQMRSMSETWRGYIIPLESSVQKEFITDARNLLKEYISVRTTTQGICISGHLETPNQEKLERLAQEYKAHIKQDPIRVIGDYFSFLGDFWIEEAMDKPKQISLF